MKGLQYEYLRKYFSLSPKEQKEELYEDLDLPNLTIHEFSFEQNSNAIPEAQSNIDFTAKKLGSLNGTRLFIPINPFNNSTYIPEKIKERKYPIVFKDCGMDSDTLIMELPTNYTLEYIPEPVEIITPYV